MTSTTDARQRMAVKLAPVLCALLMLVTLSAGGRAAQADSPAKPEHQRLPTVAEAPLSPHELTRADLQAWLDGFLPYALERGDVAGAVVAVVQDGEVVLQKGYGYADVENQRPVDPQRTLFRAGSVGKLITETAVMQLVEQGRLELDADINEYLDFRIPEAFGKPVTLRNLITHTGGFEELTRHLLSSDPQRFDPSLENYVKALDPARIFPPGEVPSYCNYCLALAGYIVQRVSGESFDDYLEHRIFQPLGMRSSTFRQPLPEKFAADMSMGYRRASGPAQYFELFGPAPAGSLSTTGADMARFMIAHLQAEDGAARNLLQPETARLMHTPTFRATPPVNGMVLGFFERDRNGQRILGHAGDTQFFHTDLLLYMDRGVGLFMAFNSIGREAAVAGIRDALFHEFTDRYFPAPLPQETTAPTAIEHGRLVAGMYRSSRGSQSTFFSALELLSQVEVIVNDDGTLVIPPITGVDGRPKTWHEVAPFVWREIGGRERLAAKMENGHVRFLGLDSFGGIAVLTPVPAWQSASWIRPVLLVALGTLLLTVIVWPVAALVRRRYGAGFPLAGRQALAWRLVRVAAAINVAFVFGWLLLFRAFLQDLSMSDGRADIWFLLLHLLGFIGILGAAIAIWNAWLALRSSRRWWSKAYNMLLAGACVAVSWFAFALNLAGFGIGY